MTYAAAGLSLATSRPTFEKEDVGAQAQGKELWESDGDVVKRFVNRFLLSHIATQLCLNTPRRTHAKDNISQPRTFTSKGVVVSNLFL